MKAVDAYKSRSRDKLLLAYVRVYHVVELSHLFVVFGLEEVGLVCEAFKFWRFFIELGVPQLKFFSPIFILKKILEVWANNTRNDFSSKSVVRKCFVKVCC